MSVEGESEKPKSGKTGGIEWIKNWNTNRRSFPKLIEEIGRDSPTGTLIIVFGLLTMLFVYLLVSALNSNQPSNVITLLTVFYGFLSTMFSALFSRLSVDKEVESRLSKTWLSNAKQASISLLTLSDNVKRLKIEQAEVCSNLDPYLVGVKADKAEQIKAMVNVQCGSTAKTLHQVDQQIDDNLNTWANFIVENCDDGVCQIAFRDIFDKQVKIYKKLWNEFPSKRHDIILNASPWSNWLEEFDLHHNVTQIKLQLIEQHDNLNYGDEEN